ncbi:MAG TPA: response regulator transcription factor [Candidatus Ruthenibacterium merdavium]|uniref:Stage 0 sporulation protein A homolog n=1 Tax=Candidatus Ruthenibacterium merdavium TaxID=2838752 RepID=A0A9D2Q3M8_9FIRM|nr:response regulator transcription factor [Candidatus Ruthenibacterium merdavium]
MSQATVLVVDDDKEIVGAIARLLEMEGHRVLKAYDGLQALETLTEEHVDLIILDVMMPNMDGMSATMAIRRRQNLPILLLSAKSEDADKIAGLSIGADDYLTKPYNPMELSARVNALLRRYLRLGAADNTAPSEEQLVNGGICMNLARKEVLVEGELVRLTPTEYRMLEFFMQHPNRVYSAAQIYEQVWNEPSCGVENTVMVHIRHLREKIEINPKKPNYIKVVWGLGYKMEQKK